MVGNGAEQQEDSDWLFSVHQEWEWGSCFFLKFKGECSWLTVQLDRTENRYNGKKLAWNWIRE